MDKISSSVGGGNPGPTGRPVHPHPHQILPHHIHLRSLVSCEYSCLSQLTSRDINLREALLQEEEHQPRLILTRRLALRHQLPRHRHPQRRLPPHRHPQRRLPPHRHPQRRLPQRQLPQRRPPQRRLPLHLPLQPGPPYLQWSPFQASPCLARASVLVFQPRQSCCQVRIAITCLLYQSDMHWWSRKEEMAWLIPEPQRVFRMLHQLFSQLATETSKFICSVFRIWYMMTVSAQLWCVWRRP